MRYLTIALTKGRLAKRTLELLEKTGITCEEMKDPDFQKADFYRRGTRSSNFSWPKGRMCPPMWSTELPISASLARIRSSRNGRKIYEVLDLGFGKCRMCVCGPE